MSMGSKRTRNTYLTETLAACGNAAQYDAQAKKIAADKGFLARVLKATVKELREYELPEIERFIEGVEVMGISERDEAHAEEDFMPAIAGMNSEDAAVGAGTIRCDLKFYVLIAGKERIKILINLEVQKSYPKEYDVMPRGIFYCCRTIAGQKNVEFRGDDYNGIKKTYGIWLNLNAPKEEADSIFCVELVPRKIEGNPNPESHRYDPMNVTLVGLDKDSYQKKATELHGYLGTIFSERLNVEEKLEILREEYGVEPTEEVKEDMESMCNLGEALYAEAYDEAYDEAYKEAYKQAYEQAYEKACKMLREEHRETIRKEVTKTKAERDRANAAEARLDAVQKENAYLKSLLQKTSV